MAPSLDSSQTYPCDICGKEFKRADHRKRHEESHNYTIACPVCGQYFNRRESMLRVWVKSSIFVIPVLRFDRLVCLCDAYIFSGMALL
jgi:DNA-directed RNA polymerase subunit RPC12/RpoP